jgi:hypothetical protein
VEWAELDGNLNSRYLKAGNRFHTFAKRVGKDERGGFSAASSIIDLFGKAVPLAR